LSPNSPGVIGGKMSALPGIFKRILTVEDTKKRKNRKISGKKNGMKKWYEKI
jgi:hypothetical protein